MTSEPVAVVVGAASGIGAAVAEHHRRAGYRVVTWDVEAGCDVFCDVADPEAIATAADQTIAEAGTPERVTFSAGIASSGLLADAEASAFDEVMAVNARGAWLVMRALAVPMSAGQGGSMVAVSSISSQLADATMGIYCASKAALDMLIRVAAKEWAPAIRVNGINPGVTDTAMLGDAPRDGRWLSGIARRTALKRLGAADDIAEAVMSLHAMTWVTGQTIGCDGGLSLHSPIVPA